MEKETTNHQLQMYKGKAHIFELLHKRYFLSRCYELNSFCIEFEKFMDHKSMTVLQMPSKALTLA